LTYAEVDTHLWNTYNNTRHLIHEASQELHKARKTIDWMNHELVREQELNRQLASNKTYLEAQLATALCNMGGDTKVDEEHCARAHELEDKQGQSGHSLMQGAHMSEQDGILATATGSDKASQAETLGTIPEENCSSTENTITDFRQPGEEMAQGRRVKRTRRTAR
jgi:hypothetical protein